MVGYIIRKGSNGFLVRIRIGDQCASQTVYCWQLICSNNSCSVSTDMQPLEGDGANSSNKYPVGPQSICPLESIICIHFNSKICDQTQCMRHTAFIGPFYVEGQHLPPPPKSHTARCTAAAGWYIYPKLIGGDHGWEDCYIREDSFCKCFQLHALSVAQPINCQQIIVGLIGAKVNGSSDGVRISGCCVCFSLLVGCIIGRVC